MYRHRIYSTEVFKELAENIAPKYVLENDVFISSKNKSFLRVLLIQFGRPKTFMGD